MAEHSVMIVEDHSPTILALTAFFGRMGWDVRGAESVAEALALLDHRRRPFCLLVLDLDLPDGSGEEILARVKAEGAAGHVIVSTACMDHDRLQRVASLGPDFIAIKPENVTGLWDGSCRICGSDEAR